MVIRAPGPRGTQAGSYAELDDRMLVLDFQAGQIEAFVEIHHRYGALARHVCGRFLPNNQDVDEALQETWIRVFQGLHRFNGRFALQSWVARIATNVSLDILRARARRPQLDDQPIDEHEREDGGDGPEEEVEKLIQRDMVIAVLAGLPDTHRRALVLRELEGRSHKEIAGELDISPAQAKALIHRAKGTFRREWLRAATERHGLAGFFLLPVIWLSKLGGLARRVADRAGEVAHVGGTEVVTQTAQAVASPIVPVAATGVGEKIVAAGLTLVVAGSVTVGAATIARHRADRDKPEAVVAAPVPVPTSDARPTEPAAPDEKAEKEAKGGHHERGADAHKNEEASPVVADPGATPTVGPTPTPEPSPTAGPSPTTSPEPLPAPPWSLTFRSSVPVGSPQLQLVASHVRGSAGSEVLFAQTASGPIVDDEETESGRLYVDYWGSVQGATGSASFWIFLDTRDGRYRYDARALLRSVTQTDGAYTYVFSGSYGLTESPVSADDAVVSGEVPSAGEITLTLGFWTDGTSLYDVEVAMEEFPASS